MNEETKEGTKEDIEPTERFADEETVGEILLAARESKGLTLESVSLETKIPVGMLKYLETDNFESIPAKVYVKGFLRSYADVLGLDVEHILSKYEVQTGQTHKSRGDLWEIEAEVVEEKLKPPRILRRFALPAVAVIVLFIVVWKISWKREPAVQPPPPLIEMTQQELVTPLQSSGAPQAAAGTESPVAVSEVVRSIMELSLTALPSDSSWIELLTVSMGEEVAETTSYSFLLLPGRTRSFSATDAFVFRMVGNAVGFTVELNGRRLSPFGDRGRVRKNVTITRDDIPQR